MLVNAFVFVVVAIVRASLRVHTEKVAHLVLVERERAGIIVSIFVVLIKFAAFAACLVLNSVL